MKGEKKICYKTDIADVTPVSLLKKSKFQRGRDKASCVQEIPCEPFCRCLVVQVNLFFILTEIAGKWSLY
jgi:hypothetical protein